MNMTGNASQTRTPHCRIPSPDPCRIMRRGRFLRRQSAQKSRRDLCLRMVYSVLNAHVLAAQYDGKEGCVQRHEQSLKYR